MKKGGENIIFPVSSIMMTSFNYFGVKNEYTNGKFVTLTEYERLIRKLKLNKILKNEI